MTVITSTLKRPNGAAWKYGEVAVAHVGPGFDGAGARVLGVSHFQADATGLVSVDLAPTLNGEWAVWSDPDGTNFPFNVPSTGGPYTLQSQLLVAPVPSGIAAVTLQMLTSVLVKTDVASARPAVGTPLWVGGTAATPPAAAVTGDYWIHP